MSVVIYIQDTGKEVAGCQAGGFFSLLRSFGTFKLRDEVDARIVMGRLRTLPPPKERAQRSSTPQYQSNPNR